MEEEIGHICRICLEDLSSIGMSTPKYYWFFKDTIVQIPVAKPGNEKHITYTFQKLREDAQIITNKAQIKDLMNQEPQIFCNCLFVNINEPPKKRRRLKLLQIITGYVAQSHQEVNMRLATMRHLKECMKRIEECKRMETSKHQEMEHREKLNKQLHEIMNKLDKLGQIVAQNK